MMTSLDLLIADFDKGYTSIFNNYNLMHISFRPPRPSLLLSLSSDWRLSASLFSSYDHRRLSKSAPYWGRPIQSRWWARRTLLTHHLLCCSLTQFQTECYFRQSEQLSSPFGYHLAFDCQSLFQILLPTWLNCGWDLLFRHYNLVEMD